MEKDTEYTEVVFRKWKDGDIIALFPYDFDDYNGILCNSYMHVGQHSSADYFHIVGNSRLATKEEYQDLFNELENHVGYKLKVIKKVNGAKWRKEREKYMEHLKSLSKV